MSLFVGQINLNEIKRFFFCIHRVGTLQKSDLTIRKTLAYYPSYPNID